MTAMTDPDRLRDAVAELARLREPAEQTTGIIPRLYASALKEWADRLGVDEGHLDRLVSEASRSVPTGMA